MSKPPRHFLDLSELPPRELRSMLAASARHEGEAEGA